MKKGILLIGTALALLCSLPLFAVDLFLGTQVTARSESASSTPSAAPVFLDLMAGIEHEAQGFRAVWALDFKGEGKYPTPFVEDYFAGFLADVPEAGIEYHGGSFGLRLGKLSNTDLVDSPYSLFASGLDLKAVLAEISYEDESFFLIDRWIGLNRNLRNNLYVSDAGSGIYKDRGAVLKSYGLRFGPLRFGFQDATVFTGSYFDLDAFVLLAPSNLVQFLLGATGLPGGRLDNQNSIMGFFADYEGDGWYAYAQLLVDDLNTNRFWYPDSFFNPDKVGFSLGGSYDSPWGRLSFYAAGATKYTYEAFGTAGSNTYYSYTYYPGSAVDVDGLTGIPIEDQMIGFLHGENSLAFLGSWEEELWDFELGATLEFTLSGAKSPANPWHELGNWDDEGEGSHWLDDPVLEKKLVLGLEGLRSFGPVELSARARLGWAWNRLELVSGGAQPYNAEPLWKPSAASGFVGELSLTGCFLVEHKE